MFRLKSIICVGCADSGVSNVFYDTETKRPLFIQCGHPICSLCVTKYEDCPVCKKKVVNIENYAARNIYEDLKKNPLIVFKKWFKAEVDGKEFCSNCHDESRKLQLCITCELELRNLGIEYVANDGTDWEDYGQRSEILRKHEIAMNWWRGSASQKWLAPRPELKDEKEWRARFRYCILDHHQGHLVKSLHQLEYTPEKLKQRSSFVAANFIWSELKSREGNCLMQTMKLHRTCERLAHLAMFYYPSSNESITFGDTHNRHLSRVNKYFESSLLKIVDKISIEQGATWIEIMEKQLSLLDEQRNCSCREVWNEMHSLYFGNQIEKKFIEIINQLENVVVSECPLFAEVFQETRNKALEASKIKLFKIYTVFCWNCDRKGICCLFDNLERQPCICSGCKMTTCMECLKINANYKCFHCGNRCFDTQYLDFGTERRYNVDESVLDLVEFYKTNCAELFEKWWTCKASELSFCLSCSSYSDSLEVCAFCELSHRMNVLRSNRKMYCSAQYHQNMPLFFNFSNLKTFPIRWQCSDCNKRLEANWDHKYCGDNRSAKWIGNWNRGCNHLLTRLYDTKTCSSYEQNADKCEYNAIDLKDIRNYQSAMKVATMGLIFRILKSGIESVQCNSRRIKLLKIYGMLKCQTRYYFKKLMDDRVLSKMDKLSDNINELIGKLKLEWTSLKNHETECTCTISRSHSEDSVSVECYGCRYKGKPNTYYDDNTKRPVFNQCGHSLCTECAEVFHNCPICDKEIQTIENFTARSLLDDYKRDAMRIFKNWWNATGNERETCTRCYEPCENLRLCLSCYSSKLDFIVVYGEENEQKPWMNSEMRQERRKQIEAFRDKSLYSETDPDADPEEIELKIYFHCDFSLFANLACCSSCILDHHGDHLVNTREELEPIMDVFKQSAAKVAVGFLTDQINQMKSSYIHISRRSALNKFFKLLPWDNLDGITRGDVDEIIENLEYQMSNLNCSEECHCSEIWDEMQLSFYRNQIEREFARVIEELNNQKIIKCSFPELKFQKTRGEAIQMSKLKLPLIYTVFCWNYKNEKLCGMFDNLNHKPCRCPNCKKPSCLECLESTKRCPFCGVLYESIPTEYEPEISNETLDLVNFYKNNFLELLIEWWHCDASKLGFCLQCNSFSNDLEICVFCELDQKPSALRTNTMGPYHRSDSLFYNFRGLKTLPIRWQCADCNQQLIENWVHNSCEDSVLNGVSWKRGCSHLNSRVSFCKLIREDGCSFKVIGLKEIQKYETAMKVSTIGLIHKIAEVAIKEQVFCEFEKMQFLKTLGMLTTRMHQCFLNSRKPHSQKMEISNQLEQFQTKWLNYQDNQTKCDCSLNETENRGKYRKKRKVFLKSFKDQLTDICPFKSCGDAGNSYNFDDEEAGEEFEIFWSQTWSL
ncbi:hypothetical protein L5515_011179 [Caenorhabditis briggsae]|uniref:RING-type domain-containing protein n=1 Tax=Caenorhabditis briggsae TaxID=6238 RepID=A0AAE9EU77_CAEBR|nr:hypothetical protein L5515_011179 [Caenorhabditis briggsae]